MDYGGYAWGGYGDYAWDYNMDVEKMWRRCGGGQQRRKFLRWGAYGPAFSVGNPPALGTTLRVFRGPGHQTNYIPRPYDPIWFIFLFEKPICFKRIGPHMVWDVVHGPPSLAGVGVAACQWFPLRLGDLFSF